MRHSMTSLIAFLGILTACVGNLYSQEEVLKTRIGDLRFTHDFANGYPTNATRDKLFDEIDFQRACQAYLWSIPIVSMA